MSSTLYLILPPYSRTPPPPLQKHPAFGEGVGRVLEEGGGGVRRGITTLKPLKTITRYLKKLNPFLSVNTPPRGYI